MDEGQRRYSNLHAETPLSWHMLQITVNEGLRPCLLVNRHKTRKSRVQLPRPCSYPSVRATMANDPSETTELLQRVGAGDQAALAALFARYRARLRAMVRLRLDRRLQGRVDPSDVLQEAYLDLSHRAAEYLANPTIPFFLWLRLLTGQRLLAVHRQHLGAQMRDAGLEVSLHRGALPEATSASLAAQLLGQFTSPTQAAVRAEMQLRLQEALNSMDSLDREVLVLRHFEELTNNEAAEVLGLQKAAASNRYMRALKRLKQILTSVPGFFDN
jgi:RNA polymerase sigma-70 factor, ECF subfamily